MGRVRLLVEHGADTTAKDEHRFTALHWASQVGSIDIARTSLSMVRM